MSWLEDLCPHQDNPLMAGAWASCLSWASGEAKILAQFEADTGHAPLPSRGRSPLDRMIDEACGFSPAEEYMRAFVPWFNERVWGDPDAPDEEETEP